MRAFWIVCALTFAATRLASASQSTLNLGWSECGGLPGSLNRTFACNTNSGSSRLVGSFLAGSNVNAASGIAGTLYLQSSSLSLPSWWGLAPGMCRDGSLTASFDFTQGPFNCYDYWQGGASGAAYMEPLGGNRARLTVEGALPEGSPLITPIPEGVEVYAFKAVIDGAKSTGLGACSGCLTGVAICFSGLTIHQATGGDKYVGLPAVRTTVYWQGGIGGDYYCTETPIQNRTWGSIKTLYR